MAKTTPEKPRKKTTRKKVTRRKSPSKKKIDSSLQSMYGEAPRRKKVASQVRLSRGRRKSRSSFIFVSLLLATFFAALAWVGFYYFAGNNTFNDKNIKISIDTPKNITSGDDIAFTIHYKNAQKTTLTNSEMRVKPPTGFVLEESEPKANGSNEFHFDLGTLSKNDSGKIIMKGTFIGVQDGNHDITTFFTYRPDNFNADFEKVTNATLDVSESPLSISVTGPDDIAAGAATTFTFTLENTSHNDIKGLQLNITPPDQFVIATTEPKQKNDTEFIIDTLAANEKWEGSFAGSFKNSAQGEHKFTFETVVITDSASFTQNEVEHFIDVTSAQLETILKVDNFEKKGSVAPGGAFTTNLTVKNNGESSMENVELILEIETPAADEKSIIDWEKLAKNKKLSLETEQLADNRMRATITWNGENTRELVSLEPDTENSQGITIPVLTPKEFGNTLPGNTIILQAKTSASGGTQSQTAPFEITLRSDTSITASVAPAGDPIVGIGPDGLTEVSVRQHDLTISLDNSIHEIIDLEILAFLADDVVFERTIDVPAGELQFVRGKNAVRWTLNRLPLSVPKLAFTIRIDTITPIGDVEKSQLLKDIQITAIDSISEEPFIIKLGSVNKK